jgi:menaquinone-dependent protoporphyrinogen oxidase
MKEKLVDMKTVVICASRYGSTIEAGRWIAQRLLLDGLDVDVMSPAEVESIGDYDVVIIGSGLYGHRMLPEMDEFIDRHTDELKEKKLALFALAMKRESIFVRGQAHGGLNHLQYLFDKLGPSVVHADILPGEMAFKRLSEQDKASLEQFYGMLGLNETETKKRKHPRTLMCKSDFWEFAETVMQRVACVGGRK